MKATHLITLTIAAATILLVASFYIEESQQDIALMLEAAIEKQTQTLHALSDLNSQNRADTVTESVIRDCSPSSRSRYQAYLNRLAELEGEELVVMEQLFDACAAFFAERNALMVARLEREYEAYTELVRIYAQLEPMAVPAYNLKTWQTLVNYEVERGTLLHDQVSIQADIITILQDSSADAGAIEPLLERAQQNSNRVATLNTLISDTRAQLSDV